MMCALEGLKMAPAIPKQSVRPEEATMLELVLGDLEFVAQVIVYGFFFKKNLFSHVNRLFKFILVTLNCGGVSNENCTYFDSSGPMAGGCSAKVCPCGDNICQMRLDFNTFVIAGPSTNTNSVTKVKAMAGVVVESADISVTDHSQCLTDTFSVTNGGGGINPPTICGTNSGEHSNVDILLVLVYFIIFFAFQCILMYVMINVPSSCLLWELKAISQIFLQGHGLSK